MASRIRVGKRNENDPSRSQTKKNTLSIFIVTADGGVPQKKSRVQEYFRV
jgi:hypothetical protein